MPIQAIRITVKGQQAVSYLVQPEAPERQRNKPPVNTELDKLSLRKATILAAIVQSGWVTTRKLQRRLADTGEFDEWTSKVSLATFQQRGLGDKLTNELIALSGSGYIVLGRNLPRTCSVCAETPDELIVTTVVSNDTWDGSETMTKRQTPPMCRACYEASERRAP